MKITLIALLCGLFIQGNAQDQRTLETKVADILTQMPTHDLKHRDRLMNDMIALGEDGLNQFIGMLAVPGTGEDTQVRFALSSLAMYVGQSGQEQGRALLSKVVEQALKGSADNEIKAFLLYHADFFAGQELVKVIAGFLPDERLNEPAVKTLVTIGTHNVTHVLMDALPSLSGSALTRAIYAIGELGDVHGATALKAYETDEGQRAAIVYAYANLGSAESYKFMINAAKESNYQYDPIGATPGLLTYAERLAKRGDLKLCENICKMLIKKCQAPGQSNYALAAISLLVDQQGYQAMDLLLKGMEHPDKKYREAILRYASQITDVGATREWMTVYDELVPPVQTELVAFLGQRGDRTALPVIESGMYSDNEALRIASYQALADLIGKDALVYILNRMAKGTDTEVDAMGELLKKLVGPRQMGMIAKHFTRQGEAGKVALLNLIAARESNEFFKLVRENTGSDTPAISQAAYKALASVSGAEHIRPLMSMLYMTKETDNLAEIQQAVIVSALAGQDNPAKPVLDAYSGATSKKERFMPIFPALGGKQSLETVAQAFEQGDAAMKKVSFEALTQWKDYSASSVLFDICKTGSKQYQEAAFRGYVRQVKSAPVPAEQKLLLLRKIAKQAKNTDQKKQLIKSLEGNKTFLTVVFLSQYLADKSVANEAGRAIATVALPPSGTLEGMYGDYVEEVLNKAKTVIAGEEADYVKANIQRWIEQMPDGDGFVSMFNGKDFTGWQGLVGNPISRAKMTEKELAKAQAEADAKVPENWTIADGEIRFTGSGYKNLCSIKEYGDFEMWVDWRINDRGDSGIYLRGTPQVQIWDTSRVEVGAQVGSGGLYNNQKHERNPLLVADNPINDWNTFYIKMVGENVTVYLNGQLVVNNVVLENYWDRSIPIFPTGPIELQAHGTDLAFRDVYVREIKSGEYNLSVSEQKEGFISLFNGKNLDGWIGNKTDYVVEDGVVVIRPKQGGHGNLYTEKEYADFNYRFEFQLTPGANNGLGIRTPPEGDAAYLGMELQILDNTAPIYANLQPYQYHGSVYGVIPAKRGFLKPVGEWNEEEVIVQGTRIKIILNGNVIVDGDIAEARDNGTLDHRDHPGLKNDKGHIGFLGHGSVVKFRNIRVKEL